MKPDFQRIQSLLREAVTMLCKNSLPYKSELCVEGLLGITLDREDIFLVNIKEILKSHEFITSVDDINDSKLVIGERSLSPVNSQEEPDNEDSSADCSTVSTRAVVPIFKPPNKVQRSHKRAVSNSSELSRHWFASVDQQASGDSRLSEWEEGVHTPPHTTPPTQHPPHNKRRRLESSHQFNSHETAIDVDSLSVMEVKKEALDENVPSASMTNYRLQHTGDNLSNLNELTNFAAVHMSQGETEAKHVLPVSLPSIAGLTSSSWHMGAGDILSTSMPSLPNLSSDMVSAGLPSSHFNNSVVTSERDSAAARPPQPPSTPEPAAHLAAAAIILATPGPFQSVRALHRKLQRRVRSSSQLMYVVEGLVRDGLASLVQVVVRPARRSKAVFYKALPPPSADDEETQTAFAQRLAGYGITPDVYVGQLRRQDPQMDAFTHAALLREHPDPERLMHFYREYAQNESESGAVLKPEHQQQLNESVMAARTENETVPELEHPPLFHRFDKEARTESETALDRVSQQRLSTPALPAQSEAETFSELHHLERLYASSVEARTETESETFPGHTFSGAPHNPAEHETPAVVQQADKNVLSMPHSY